jgi:hypothetical protein
MFKKINLKKKRIFFFYMSKQFSKIKNKKINKKRVKSFKKIFRIKSNLKIIKERSLGSKNISYIYNTKKINLICFKNYKSFNINNFL